LNQWLPVATNRLTTSGPFSFTLTNTVTAAAREQFYILKTQYP
jgi:hypothetical protein